MHPTDGALRRALDEPASLSDADRDHVAGCPRCRAALASAADDRDAAHDLLAPDDAAASPDTDAAWQRLVAARANGAADAAEVASSTSDLPAARRRRRLHRASVLAAAGAVLVVGGATAAAANDWIPVFRTESVAPVPVSLSTSDVAGLATMGDLSLLSGYGQWQVLSRPGLHSAPDAAAAQRRTGLPVAALTDLPTGVTGTPSYEVMDKQSAVFRFSADKAARTVAASGGSLPTLPADLDGAVLRLQAGPAVVRVWQQSSGMPTLIVAELGAPAAESSGAPLPVLRDALLSLPGLPPALAAQLRAVTSDGTTLPIPVPADEFSSSATEVQGAPATLLTSHDGTLNGVVWVSDGVVRLVAGPLSADEVRSVADDLG